MHLAESNGKQEAETSGLESRTWLYAASPYGWALLSVFIATLVRLSLDSVIHNGFPYASYLLSVVIVAVACGWQSGATALLLTFLTANYLFVPPGHTLLPVTGGGWSAGIIYLINGSIVVVLAEGMRRARQRAERSAKKAMDEVSERREAEARIAHLNTQLQRMMRETHHRVKNNLQIITALVEMQTATDHETVPADELKRIALHVRTLAHLHDLLTDVATEKADLELVSVSALFKKLAPMLQATLGPHRLTIDITDALLPTKQSSSFALLVNEIVSNAAKHGRGDIEIKFVVEDGTARLEVCDDGPGFAEGFDPIVAAHTGMDLIDTTARWDLGGEVRYDNRPQGGARVTVTFPIIQSAVVATPVRQPA
jgi:two-component system, sensor histidine kinase PdtaS